MQAAAYKNEYSVLGTRSTLPLVTCRHDLVYRGVHIVPWRGGARKAKARFDALRMRKLKVKLMRKPYPCGLHCMSTQYTKVNKASENRGKAVDH